MAEPTVAVNRKAYYDYQILRTLEAGIVLTGTEIKSIRQGQVNLRDSYARPQDGELWLVGAHIARYAPAAHLNHDPYRPRKLLLHRQELRELTRAAAERGATIVPLRLYLKGGRAKLELALVRGKRQYDKRQAIAQREAQRHISQALRRRA